MNEPTRAAERFYHQHLGSLSPAERPRVAAEPSIAMRHLAEAGVRDRAPEASAREVTLLVVTRPHGGEVAPRFFALAGSLAG